MEAEPAADPCGLGRRKRSNRLPKADKPPSLSLRDTCLFITKDIPDVEIRGPREGEW